MPRTERQGNSGIDPNLLSQAERLDRVHEMKNQKFAKHLGACIGGKPCGTVGRSCML
jgi:hypothetical protein